MNNRYIVHDDTLNESVSDEANEIVSTFEDIQDEESESPNALKAIKNLKIGEKYKSEFFTYERIADDEDVNLRY